jgi:capsular polysaccharide transport system ATP-binding protein
LIKLQNVTKFFKTKKGKKMILDNVSIEIPTGKNIGILGRNGAGKSTLLRILGKIDFPNSGEIITDVEFSWPMGVSGGFQGSMTGRENVKFVCRIYGLSHTKIKKCIEFVQDFAEIGNYFDMPIKSYSSGMKSRLSFGLSLFFDFDYFIIDEILSVGDKGFQQKSKEALRKKITTSNAILVSHSMDTLIDICDVGIYLDNGKVTYFDDIKEAIECYQKNM